MFHILFLDKCKAPYTKFREARSGERSVLYSKDLEILIQQGSSTGAYPIISEERRSPQLGEPKSSKTKSINAHERQRTTHKLKRGLVLFALSTLRPTEQGW